MECGTAEANNGGKLGLFMKDIEWKIKPMEKAGSSIAMGKFTLEIGWRIKLRGMACLYIRMALNMKVNGWIIWSKAMELNWCLTEPDMKGNSIKDKSMGQAKLVSAMDLVMKESLSLIIWMAKAFISTRMGLFIKGIGCFFKFYYFIKG